MTLETRMIRGALALALGFGVTPAATRSYPVDCLPDRALHREAGASNAGSLFGSVLLPGVVLGPPGDSSPVEGSFSVASLGFGGSVVVAFDDIVIEDRPGPDFIVFENAFFRLPLPGGAADDYALFAEPAIVEVSEDGQSWVAFAYDPAALAAASGVSEIHRAERLALAGLAGISPSFTGNWTVPDVPASFDPAGSSGISGAGGDAFDLADVGLTQARFVRVTDADSRNGFAGSGEGADLDAVVVLHGRPVQPSEADRDGDGLSDLAEPSLYGSDPDLADTDGDGVDDGREVAGCRDPNGPGTDPWLHDEPRIWAVPTGPCTELRWTFLGSGVTYDVIRGDLAQLAAVGDAIDLGLADCLAADSTSLRWSCDGDTPDSGAGRFYLVRTAGPGYGRGSDLAPREAPTACP